MDILLQFSQTGYHCSFSVAVFDISVPFPTTPSVLWLCYVSDSISGVNTFVGGLLASTGQWVWVDGSAVGSFLWKPGEPNNASGSESCTTVSGANDRALNDMSCQELCQFVCEI